MILNEDVGRELEIMMAKLRPFDGETDYGTDDKGRTGFLGYSLRPYRIYRPAKKAWACGHRITAHYRGHPPTEDRIGKSSIIHIQDIDGKTNEREALKESRSLTQGTKEYKNFWNID